MAPVATIKDVTLQGDQIRVNLVLPAGITAPERGFSVPAASADIIGAIAALARPAKNNDAQVKTNLSVLQPGLQIDLTDPTVIPPPPPTADDMAVQAFSSLLQTWRRETNKTSLQIPGADAESARAAVVA